MKDYIKSIKLFIKEPYRMLEFLNYVHFYDFFDDETFQKIIYYINTGKKIDLQNPSGFNEKIKWLMVHYHNDLCSQLSDKYLVRDYIKNKIGDSYLIPLLGVYEKPEDIDYSKLPNEFVLKCNHNSGIGMCICKNKNSLDIEKVNARLKKGLKANGYRYSREWNYKNIEPLIVCEQYMQDQYSISKGAEGLIDYKFYCFNGEPKFLYASLTKQDKSMVLNYYDMDFNPAPFYRADHNGLPFNMEKPRCFEEMKRIAKVLSKGFPFVRVDLYQINDKVYFSEMTFTPAGANTFFSPEEWEKKIGDWLILPKAEQE